MSDINVEEDPPTPELPLNTSTSSPIEDKRSPKEKSHVNETDIAMQGIVTEKGFDTTPSKKVMNPDTLDWLDSSPDIKLAKKATEQIYSSIPQKHKTIRDFNNADEKKLLKA